MKNVIPCLFTSGNLSFGVLSMIMTLHGLYTWAGVCILLAMVCDACDGRSARALGVAGDFGKELDSLSDVVSFGAASAFLIYSYSLQSLGWIGAIPAIIYAALGGIRLARFNLNTGVIHGYFQGMPIPNGGCLIATYVISGAVLPAWLLAIFWSARSITPISKGPARTCSTNRPWPFPSSSAFWSWSSSTSI